MPLLCTDKPKIRDLCLTENQIKTMVSNFKFFLTSEKIMLKISDLNPKFVKQIENTVKELYLNMGLDVVVNSIFII